MRDQSMQAISTAPFIEPRALRRAIRAARPPVSITHKPGCMLVTDVRNAELAVAA